MRSWSFVSTALVMVGACSLQQGGTAAVGVAADSGPVIPDGGPIADGDATSIDDAADANTTLAFIDVSVGPARACGVTSLGAVKCWGNGVLGGNGDGTTNNRAAPVEVSGLANAETVAVGRNHTCATTATGGVKCWGGNASGQLGDSTVASHTTAVDTMGLTLGARVVAVVAGDYHTCALTDAGAVKCWGKNDLGQLGDDSLLDRNTAVAVSGLASGVVAITAGEAHTCALTTAGAVKCWGKNDGQLGDNSTTKRNAPVDVDGLATGVRAIGAGANHTCAALVAGGAKCWGVNASGQLGDGTQTDKKTPVVVGDLAGQVASISGGAAHSCARLENGNVSCWGSNAFAELGDGTTTIRLKAVASSIGGAAASLDAGGYATCAIIAGKARCWGRPDDGVLGNGEAFHVTATTMPSLGSGVTAISSGPHRSCTIKAGSVVTCWGDDAAPSDVSGLGAVVSIAVGNGFTCSIVGGGLKCFGVNAYGQLGDNTTVAKSSPADVSGLTSGVASVSAGNGYACARTTGSGAKCWGKNDVGQLGDSTKAEKHVPSDVNGLTSNVAAIDTSSGVITCALMTGGTVKCWGNGGQVPVDVATLTGATALSVGLGHACAIVAGGAVKCWGMNASGQLGDGSFVTPAGVVSVSGITGAVAISAGDANTCALMTGGGVKCWGANSGGQLGNGSTIDENRPVDTLGVVGATAISVGSTFACAVVAGGAASCWGRAERCQLGTCVFASPTDVNGP